MMWDSYRGQTAEQEQLPQSLESENESYCAVVPQVLNAEQEAALALALALATI